MKSNCHSLSVFIILITMKTYYQSDKHTISTVAYVILTYIYEVKLDMRISTENSVSLLSIKLGLYKSTCGLKAFTDYSEVRI